MMSGTSMGGYALIGVGILAIGASFMPSHLTISTGFNSMQILGAGAMSIGVGAASLIAEQERSKK